MEAINKGRFTTPLPIGQIQDGNIKRVLVQVVDYLNRGQSKSGSVNYGGSCGCDELQRLLYELQSKVEKLVQTVTYPETNIGEDDSTDPPIPWELIAEGGNPGDVTPPPEPPTPPPPDSTDWLMFWSANPFNLNINILYADVWYAIGTTSFNIQTRENATVIAGLAPDGRYYVYLKAKTDPGATWNAASNYCNIGGANVHCVGNINVLIDWEKVRDDIPVSVPNNFFYSFFNTQQALVEAPQMPSLTIGTAAYYSMYRLTNIANAPALPALTVPDSAYRSMFQATQITTPPALPAMNIGPSCYNEMFASCTQLQTVPLLPATTLSGYCYYWMFNNCTSLKSLPLLPATSLPNSCYYGMFQRCTGLKLWTNGPGTAWRVPSAGTGVMGSYSVAFMFLDIGVSDAPATPLLNTTYYVDSDRVSVPITSAALTITGAVAGQAPVTTAPSDTTQYTASAVSWTPSPATFDWATAYTATVILNSKIGYNFTSLTTATINGNNASVNFIDGDSIEVSYIFTTALKQVISTAAISVTAPAIGAAPNSTATGTGNFSVGTVTWNPSPSAFTYGVQYTASVTLTANAGYTFTGFASGTINGSSATITSNTGTAITLSWTFAAMSLTIINYAHLTVANPADGVALPTTVSTSNTGFTTAISWSPNDATAQVGVQYTATIVLTANAGYTFTGFSSGTINGFSPTVTNNTGSSITFSRQFPAVPAWVPPDSTGWLKFSSPSSFGISLSVVANSSYTRFADYNLNQIGSLLYQGNTPSISATYNAANSTWELYVRSEQSGSSQSTLNRRVNISGSNVSCSGDVNCIYNYRAVLGEVPMPFFETKFRRLFYNQTALIAPPTIPDLSMSDYYCESMFEGCTNLQVAPALPATTLDIACYSRMFYSCTSLVNAPAVLPAMQLANYCYNNMFYDCTSLTTAPSLPATTMRDNCYVSMFEGCTNLQVAPALQATNLAEECYYSMFYNCTSLVNAPAVLPAMQLAIACYANMFRGCTSLVNATAVLPATQLVNNCYNNMFRGCTSLVNAPSLPAMQLVNSCYANMFNGCTSLTTAPSLPATQLVNSCYANMFSGCTSLTTAPSLSATTLAYNCYYSMFDTCTALAQAPALPATTLAIDAYSYMFYNCTALTTTTKGGGQLRIPSSGTIANYGGGTQNNVATLMMGGTNPRRPQSPTPAIGSFVLFT